MSNRQLFNITTIILFGAAILALTKGYPTWAVGIIFFNQLLTIYLFYKGELP